MYEARSSNAWGWGFVASVAAVSTVLGRAFTAIDPGPQDAQLFAYIGDMWRQGHALYLDLWDIKPPGIFAVSAITFTILPRTFASIAFVEGVAVLAAIGSVCLVARRTGLDDLSVMLATTAAAISTNLWAYNEGGNLTEVYLLAPSCLSIWCFIGGFRSRQIWAFACAGLFSGIGTLFKLPGAAPLLAEMALVLVGLAVGRLNAKHSTAVLLALASGFGLAWLPAIAFFQATGGLGELITVSFLYPFTYGWESQRALVELPILLSIRLQHAGSIAVAALVGALVSIERLAIGVGGRFGGRFKDATDVEWTWLLVTLWAAGDLAAVMAGGRFYPHYFLAVWPSFSVLAGVAFYWLSGPEAGEVLRRPIRRVGLFACFVMPLTLAQAEDAVRLARAGQETPIARDTQAVVEVVNRVKAEGDRIYVWDYLPSVYFETGLLSASRFTSSEHLRDSPETADRLGRSIIADIDRVKPRFIVAGSEVFGSPPPNAPFVREFVALSRRLDYEVALTTESLSLLELRPGS